MAINVPKLCPWCEAPITERHGPEQTALLGTRVYGCGTRIGIYGALFQITSATTHPEQSGWRTHEELLNG